MYYQVQDVLDGRKRNYRLKVVSNATLPLRGFIIRPKCGKILTGSASKGHTHYYSYYHCVGGCTSRFRADNVNQLFIRELKKYVPKPAMEALYKITLQEVWQEQTGHLHNNTKQLTTQIIELEDKLSYIRDLLASKRIEPAHFREMKSDYASKLEKLEAKFGTENNEPAEIKDLLNNGIKTLLSFYYIYENGDIEKKREIISSIYPEKITFNRFALRTNLINEMFQPIYSLDKDLSKNKNGTNRNNSSLPCQVGVAGFEPTTSWSQTRRDTGLRYTPNFNFIYRVVNFPLTGNCKGSKMKQ